MTTHKRVLYNDDLILMGSQVSSKSFNSAKLVHYITVHYAGQQEISKDVSRKVSHFCSWVFATMYCYSSASFGMNLTTNKTMLTWRTSLVMKTLHLTQANCQLCNIIPTVWHTGPCHHGRVRTEVANGGTACIMYGSCGYTE